MIDFTKQIADAETQHAAAKDAVAALMGAAIAEERDLSDAESAELGGYELELKAIDKRVNDWKTAEKAMGATLVKSQAPGIITHQGLGRERKPGEVIFRQATMALMAHVQRKSLEEIAATHYAHDPDMLDLVKSNVDPAQTTVSGWASELVDNSLQGFQDILRGASIAGGLLGEAGTQLQFDSYGSITIPTRAGTDQDLRSGFVKEGDPLPVQRGTVGSIVIKPYQWGVISHFTKQMAKRSTPAIEALVRQFIMDDTATALDNDFFGTAAAVADTNPAGMWNGVAGSAGSVTADLATRISEDLTALVKPILDAKMGGANGTLRVLIHPTNLWIMSNLLTATGVYLFRDEIAAGRIGLVEFRSSHNIPVDELRAIDMKQVAWAPSAPTFEVSDSATLVEADLDGSAPEVSDVGTAARDTVNDPNIRSLFQTNSIAVKHTQDLSWHKMRSGCVSRLHTIDYSA